MAETTRISQLSAHDGKPDDDDMLVMVDVSDDTQSAEGSTKQITYSDMVSDLTVSLPSSANWDTAYTTVTANSATWSSSASGSTTSTTTQSTEAAHISANGTIINQTNDWIDSVDVVNWSGPDDGKKYVINFKTNYFSVAPAIVVTPKHVSNVTHVFAQYVALDSTKCEVAFQDYKVDISDLKLTDFCIIAGASGGSSTFGGGSSGSLILEATASTDQTINRFTNTTLTFNDVKTNTDSAYSSTNGVWTAPRDMKVSITLDCEFKYNAVNGTKYTVIQIVDPDNTAIHYASSSDSSSSDNLHSKQLNCTAVVSISAGQKILPTVNYYGDGTSPRYLNSNRRFTIVELDGGGGSSSGGGFQSNQITKDNFAGDFVLPDALYVPLIRSGVLTLRPFYFNGFFGTTENAFAYIQYEWIIGKNERFTINFSNNTHGGFASASNHGSTTTTFNLLSITSATTSQPSIKEFIADDRAVYFGGVSAAGGDSSSTTLPVGSVLQKVVSAFTDNTSLSTVGTEIASLDITPKASDSQLLCEITFLWQEQGTNGSQQQGKFYIDDVAFGGHWYNHINSTANRLQTSLRAVTTVSDTNTKTISHKLTLDDLDAARVGSIVMSIEEIAQSTYTL